jgi:DNA-binding protein HU-beta
MIANILSFLHLDLNVERNRLTCNHIRSARRITVTKADIIDQISAGTGLTKLETEAVVNGFISVVKAELKRGGRVDLRGFGSFTVQHRAARTARNPRKNIPVHVPATNIPAFKPSKEFKKEVDDSIS